MADLKQQAVPITESKDNGVNIQAEVFKDLKEGCILHLSGYIDTFNSVFLQIQGKRLVDFGYTKLIFDFSNLQYISSTGIGVFAEFLRLLNEKQGMFVIANASTKIYDVFNLLGFSKLFIFTNSLDEAKKILFAGLESVSKPFPKVVACSVCHKKFRVSHPGRYYCPGCHRVLAVR